MQAVSFCLIHMNQNLIILIVATSIFVGILFVTPAKADDTEDLVIRCLLSLDKTYPYNDVCDDFRLKLLLDSNRHQLYDKFEKYVTEHNTTKLTVCIYRMERIISD